MYYRSDSMIIGQFKDLISRIPYAQLSADKYNNIGKKVSSY